MNVFVTKNPDGTLTLMARAEGDGAVGDWMYDLAPGQSVLGRTFEEWAAKAPEIHQPAAITSAMSSCSPEIISFEWRSPYSAAAIAA